MSTLFNNNNNTPEIVINSTKISSDDKIAKIYDFVLDQNMNLARCCYVESLSDYKIELIDDYHSEFDGSLFELNHVRVNPKLNNNDILDNFKQVLLDSGVSITDPPDEICMAICYKPIGELNDVVRFYLDKQKSDRLVFLSQSVKLSLV